jgi:hypothetical protein
MLDMQEAPRSSGQERRLDERGAGYQHHTEVPSSPLQYHIMARRSQLAHVQQSSAVYPSTGKPQIIAPAAKGKAGPTQLSTPVRGHSTFADRVRPPAIHR